MIFKPAGTGGVTRGAVMRTILPLRVKDDVELAVGVDAERADGSQHRTAAEFGCMLAPI